MKKKVIIDGITANKKENMRYRGLGMVSANNSSRLLIDYKWEHPEEYRQIIKHIFGENGLAISHLKLEMGSDINSSSGTEPSVMRSAEEKADVTRGAGFQLACDAKKVNPQLTLDMLWWSEPKWITDSDDVYSSRYSWYKGMLDEAYNTYGLKFDYVSVVQNERAADYEWIKYFAKRLKAETNCPYDYSKIKIVGGEEVCTWGFAEVMANDEELANLVDIIGSHYTSSSSDTAKELAWERNKELWLSEGCSPASYAEGVRRFDSGKSGMSDINGSLDIANRIIAMYPNGGMTLYEFQPVVAAYYDGVTYCHKQLIDAAFPWSGYYKLDSGFYTALHFSRFFKKGWTFIDSACFCDGKVGGDGHAIVDANFSYMTAADPYSDAYSMIIVNSCEEEIEYCLQIKNLKKASSPLYITETAPSQQDDFSASLFVKTGSITPEKDEECYVCRIKVKPHSIITLSTIEDYLQKPKACSESKNLPLELPYCDDFSYESYDENYLLSRGNAPRYTTDQGGAFEVIDGTLVQQITLQTKANEWGYTPEPITTLGDDRWFNYSASVLVTIVPSDDEKKSYAGIGIRYTLACESYSGYYMKLYEDGFWQVFCANEVIGEGIIGNFDVNRSHLLKVSALDDKVCGYIDGIKLIEHKSLGGKLIGGGRVSLLSSYHNNRFNDLSIEPLTENYLVTRFDNTDECFNYEGDWHHETMSSFANYKRTISTGISGCSFTLDFNGEAVYLFGKTDKATVSAELDGNKALTKTINEGGARRVSLRLTELEDCRHLLKITVLEGIYSVDGAEILKKRD